MAMRQLMRSSMPNRCRISFCFSFVATLALCISALWLTAASSNNDTWRSTSRRGASGARDWDSPPDGDQIQPNQPLQAYDEGHDDDEMHSRWPQDDYGTPREPPPPATGFSYDGPYGGGPRPSYPQPQGREHREVDNGYFRRRPRDDNERRQPASEPFLSRRNAVPPDHQQQQQQQQQQRFRPKPQGESTSYNPIHYEFQSVSSNLQGQRHGSRRPYSDNEDDELPETFLDQSDRGQGSIGKGIDRGPKSASPRRDAVTKYMSTTKGKVILRLCSSIVGASIGAFVGKSLFNKPQIFSKAFFLLFFIATLLRNPYGELARALGLALIFSFQRSHSVRRRYPTWPHIKASFGAAPRIPFPPSDTPWAYRPQDDRDVEFRMLYSVVAMAFIGSTCGGNLNLPLLPTWMGGIAGAGLFAFATNLKSARGDLARAMGMRVVSLCEEVLDINSELQIIRKLGVVSGRVVDKMLFLDRKHRIKDRLIALMTWVYGQFSRTISQVQNEMQEGGSRRPNVE